MSPKARQWLYTVSAIASAVIPLLVVYRILDNSAATAWVNVIGVLGAIATGGSATAAMMTNKQRKDGTFDAAPTNPADMAITALQAAVTQATTAANDLDRVKQAAADVVGQVDRVADIIAPGSLVDRMLDATRDELNR